MNAAETPASMTANKSSTVGFPPSRIPQGRTGRYGRARDRIVGSFGAARARVPWPGSADRTCPVPRAAGERLTLNAHPAERPGQSRSGTLGGVTHGVEEAAATAADGGPEVRSCAELWVGQDVEAWYGGSLAHQGRVTDILPSKNLLWIVDTRNGTRRLLDAEAFSIRRMRSTPGPESQPGVA